MKTKLPNAIRSVDEAKVFLKELFDNGEDFHPEDDANDLNGDPFTKEEGDLLNKLMSDIYKLTGNENPQDMRFDPCEYLLMLDPDYVENIKRDDPEWYNEIAPKYGYESI